MFRISSRRFTFGASAEELEKAQADGYARTVDRLLETKTVEPPVLAGAEERPARRSP